MKILFHHTNEKNESPLCRLGIENCYLKFLSYKSDQFGITKKRHHHKDYEVHLVISGNAAYEIEGESISISKGEYVIIPPFWRHTAILSSDTTEKYSLSFSVCDGSLITPMKSPVKALADDDILAAVSFVKKEYEQKQGLYRSLIENRVFEIINLLFRDHISNSDSQTKTHEEKDPRLLMAERYISDNIDMALSVTDVASYLALGEKQLTRLFLKYNLISPLRYINEKRAERIKILMHESDLTLSEISEKMNFNNEYYFNTFFKRHMGMSPGAYKKMIK